MMIKKLNVKRVTKEEDGEDNGIGESGSLVLSYIASTDAVDRYGDIVEQQWELDGYQKNPVVLFNHRQDSLPIGKAKNIKVENNQLMIDIEFDMEDSEAARIARKAKNGFLNAVSVGFQPLDFTPRAELPKDNKSYAEIGNIYHKSELLEVSIVTVPANSSATEQMTAAKFFSFGDFEDVFKSWNGKKAKTRFLSSLRKHILRVEETEDRYIVHFKKDETSNEEIEEEIEEIENEDGMKWLEDYLEGKQNKAATEFADLPIAPKEQPYNPNEIDDSEIIASILGDDNWERMSKAFAWVDIENAESIDGYKFKIARLLNSDDPENAAPDSGELTVFFDLLQMEMELLNESNVIPDEDREGVYKIIAAYYEKFGEEPPELKEYDAAEEEEEEAETVEESNEKNFNIALIRALTEQ
tara:strand:+ start:1990 stop:3228 length:1239 start_codon:yes stop_codon:yes gene_type:complete